MAKSGYFKINLKTLILATAVAMAPIWSVIAEAPTPIALPANATFISRQYADQHPEAPVAPPANGQPAVKPKNVRLDATSLREALLAKNLTIEQEYNQLQQAKANVNLNRDRLFPSINLTFGASFIIKAVSFLLPFLLPTNWFNLKQSKALLESEKKSYALMQYNMYAQAYSLLASIIGDYHLTVAARDIYDNFEEIRQIVQSKHDAWLVPDQDLALANGNAKTAHDSLINMEVKLNDDVAGVRQLLSLDLDQNMEFVEDHVPVAPDENMALGPAFDKALDLSLEYKQGQDLIDAAKAGIGAAAWSWLGGFSLSSAAGATNSSAFSGLQRSGSISFGLDWFDTYDLAKLNKDHFDILRNETYQNEKLLVETTIPSVTLMVQGLDDTEKAEGFLKSSYEGYRNQYQAGLTDITTLVNSANTYATTQITHIQAQTNLDLDRINLHRIMLTDQFSQIKGCNNNDMSKAKKATLESLCKPPSKP